MQESRNHNYLKGAAILAAASLIAKFISVIYKIPVFTIMDDAGVGTFQTTYTVYTFVLAISTAGIPAALSRIVSSANASGNTKLARRYFNVALPAFVIIGLIAMLIMFFFADSFAAFMNNPLAAPGIRVLAPAVFFACIISVYRGYTQGHENMIPTAMSQIVEVLCKAIVGISAAFWLAYMGYQTTVVSAGAISGVSIGLGLAVPLMVWYTRKLNKSVVIKDGGSAENDSSLCIFTKIMRVSIPITLSSVFMSAMVLIDSRIVLGRLQSALGLTVVEASEQFGIYALGLTLYNLPPAILVPISVSIIPAIAAAIERGRDGEAGIIMQSSVKLVNLIAMPTSVGLMVLASPILMSLYRNSMPSAATILTILGAASFFVCLQYISTAILQANGHERVALMTFPIGAAIKLLLAYILSGNPNIGIIASPIGTLACFIVISFLNFAFIRTRVKDRPRLRKVFLRPLLCSMAMAAASFGAYTLFHFIGAGILGTGQLAVSVFLVLAIIVGISVYGVLIVVTRTVTLDDMRLVPRGEKLAKLLRIRT